MSTKTIASPVAWVEKEVESQDLIYELADAIAGAVIKDLDGSTIPNRWVKVYEEKEDLYVSYTENFRSNVQGVYKHAGKSYNVYKIPNLAEMAVVDSQGFIREYQSTKKIQVKEVTYTDITTGQEVTRPVFGILLVNIEDSTNPVGYTCKIVRQIQKSQDGESVPLDDWNMFEIVGDMPSDWNYALTKQYWKYDYRETDHLNIANFLYKFTERYYTASTVAVPGRVVLKATPDVPANVESKDYFVMFERPPQNNNYIIVKYGLGFAGTSIEGDSVDTYDGICDPTTVRVGSTPVIIDQVKAQDMYRQMLDGEVYVMPEITWQKDIDGVTEIVSPDSLFFYASDSVLPWLPNKKRRPDYKVKFWVSVNNERLALILEGDPAPGISDYYRSFAYIGKIIPFNEYDHPGNFGVTVGMGELKKERSGFTINDIRENSNPKYAGWGEYTSNGMYSMSMLKTASNVMFQAHYPAFMTHLPNYPSVGTLPKGLQRLVLDKDGFQASQWTGKYHASPIYLFHIAEGYRGYLDGVVAIHDHNLVNLDELLVDTEVPKDPEDESKGTYTEVYKFFSLKSPVNMFKYSPTPDEITVAILKEIK